MCDTQSKATAGMPEVKFDSELHEQGCTCALPRWLWAGKHGDRQSGPLDQLLGAFPYVATAWLFAWLEIYATTMDAIKEQFSCGRRPS